MTLNVLLTAVGRRGYLVDYFKQIVHPLGGKVYATNTVKDCTGFMNADEAVVVPPSADSSYSGIVVELCRKWDIRLLFSLHDWDALTIAKHQEEFRAVGTLPVIGSQQLLETCLDKYATTLALAREQIPVPQTVLALDDAVRLGETAGYPLIVKPRWGQGSLGLFYCHSHDELTWAYHLSASKARVFSKYCSVIDPNASQVIVQECVRGIEYGCDIVNDLSGNLRKVFVKQKLGMRAGETDIAESIEKPELEKYAQRIGKWSRHLGCMDSDWIIGNDNLPYLIELNPRFGGGYPFTHCAGANVALACVNWAKGIDDDSWYRNYKTGIRTYKEISLRSNNV